MKKVAITGIGLINPHGENKEAVWAGLVNKKSALSLIDRFDSTDYGISYAGIIKNDLHQYFPARTSKKLDRFTQLAMIAANEAITDAALSKSSYDKTRIGVYVGNCLGGWEFTDRELRNLYTEGAEVLSPYLATAWFPAAPQGEITIAHGFKGQSKTFDSGEATGLVTINYAAEAIRQGKLDVVVAGGVEAPLNPFMLCALQSMGNEVWSKTQEYSPFAMPSSGRMPAEAAGFVILEDFDRAIERQAKIYAVVNKMGQATCPHGESYTEVEQFALHRSMKNALNKSGIEGKAISAVFADGASMPVWDKQEMAAIEKIFSNAELDITVPRSLFGHSIAASGAIDVALAALCLQHQLLLPTSGQNHLSQNIVRETTSKSLKHLLINACSSRGVAASLVLSHVN